MKKGHNLFDFFSRYEIFFVISQLYSLALGIICVINIPKGIYYVMVAALYFVMFFIRSVTFFFSYLIKRKTTDSLNLSKKRNLILFMSSMVLLGLTNFFAIALISFSVKNLSSTLPTWFFAGVMLPCSLLHFVGEIIARKIAKNRGDASLEARADQSLITAIYSLVAGCIFFMKFIPDSSFRAALYIIIIVSAMLVQTVLLIISLINGLLGIQGRRKPQKQLLLDEFRR